MTKYPYQEGETIVLGPEIFASTDGQVISWRGANYVPQQQPDRDDTCHCGGRNGRHWHRCPAVEGAGA